MMSDGVRNFSVISGHLRCFLVKTTFLFLKVQRCISTKMGKTLICRYTSPVTFPGAKRGKSPAGLPRRSTPKRKQCGVAEDHTGQNNYLCHREARSDPRLSPICSCHCERIEAIFITGFETASLQEASYSYLAVTT